MNQYNFTRRDFLKTGLAGSVAIAAGLYPFNNPPVVSVVKIKNGNIGFAVEKALDLIGGPDIILKDKNKIMLYHFTNKFTHKN